MLKDSVKECYLEKDFNCAETVLRVCNEAYNLGISEDDMKLISGFGAGLCSGKACGAICSAVAVLSRMAVGERAHATPGFRDLISGLVKELEDKFSSIECSEIVKTYKKDDVRCLETVEIVTEILENYLKKNGLAE